ncbi:hypothetical protein B0H10DRAFT_2234749 [Mycena sp. CBHHK59/15]|nr:hypothetical protein B0H10DRAFT_2234749 [Mycena sp. CBHHK59/15]
MRHRTPSSLVAPDTLHIGGPAHVENVANVKKTRPITNYFSSKPAVTSTSTPSTTPASLNSVPVSDPTPSASTSRIIDVDLLVDDVGFDSDLPPHPMDSDPRGALLSRLRIAISTIPSTIPLGCDTDHLASFSVNPVTLVGPGQDPWEDVVHGVIDAIMYDGGRSKDTVQLSQIIRRGELGMTGFANWVESCFFELGIPLGMLEPRIDRIIQAMVLLGASTVIEPLVPRVAPAPLPRASPMKTKTISSAVGCPGQDLPLKEGAPSFLSYPLALHAERDLPWNVEFGLQLIIRSHECKRQVEATGVCFPCEKLLRNHIIKGIIQRNETGINPGTRFSYLTVDDAQTLLRKKNSQVNSLKLVGLTLSQTLLVRATHLAAHSRLQLAVSRGDVPRIHSSVSNCMKNGDSIFTCIEKVGRAADENFKDRSYTREEHQLLYLLLKLGGHAAADLGHRCLGLPSISATKRHVGSTPLIASPRAPTREEMHRNLDIAFRTPVPPPHDEQAEALHAGLANNDIHLASEATVIAVSSFSDIPVRNIAHPFVVAPTCKRETTDGQKILLSSARDAVNAKASLMLNVGTLPYSSPSLTSSIVKLFKKLGDLPLFDYHCGSDDLTGNIDLKHIFKRFRNTLIRLLATTIDGVVLTPQLIKQHLLRDSKLSPQRIDKILAPNDRQDIKLMYDLLSALAVLPEARETDTPAFRNNRRAYTNVNLSLHEQLVHISAAMHLMMAIYQKEGGRFVPSQTYFDFMTAGKNIFFCVAKTQLDDPSGKFWIILLGTDALETTFGKVRTITGNDSNTDVAQLASRITAAVQCDNILAEHPEWARDPRRLRWPVWQDVAGDVSAKIDHISPRSWLGDTSVAKVSTKTTWMSGREIAERELLSASWVPSFKSMEETGGFNIFCPFGKGKMVLLTAPEEWEAHERSEDDDERDVEQLTAEMIAAANTTSEAAPPADSDTPFLPDFDDLAQEAVTNLEPAPTQAPEAYLHHCLQ